jgi:glycosyltransferase involved in cell wall biosynthesis
MSARIRVAFVHDAYPPYRRPLFDRLAQRYDLHCFFLNEDPRALPPGSESLRGYRLPEMSDFTVAPALVDRILAAHSREPFDVVLCPEPANFSALAAGWAARRIRRPYVVFSGEWYTARHPRRALTSGLERSLVRGAAYCLAYGTRVRERLIRMGVDPDRILITGNASPYQFAPAPRDQLERARSEWSIGQKPVILFLGRLMAFKAPEILIEAFSILCSDPAAFLFLAGDGPRRDAIRHQVEQLGLRDVHITGREVRTDAEKNLLYSLAKIFVLPSRAGRIAEPWGLVLNEAAAAGLPIVTTDGVGAAGDLICDGKTGRVVRQGDASALAEAISGLLRAPETAQRLGNQARAKAAEFTIDRMADAFGQAFDRAVGGNR